MATTTHQSAGRRRRQRLRRTLGGLLALLLVGGPAGYAVWGSGDHPPPKTRSPQASARNAQGLGGAEHGSRVPARGETSTQRTPSGSAAAQGSPAGGFAPVVTDRIPRPTTSLPLEAAVPGTTNMQASAARAFQRAFVAARVDGEHPQIRSAWRSEQWQQVLFDRAVAKYGSRAEAAKWVLSPLRSAHVKGYAIDVHPASAAAWLEQRGAAYGLCRTYDNEWWHFEYRATSTCPPRLPTAAG